MEREPLAEFKLDAVELFHVQMRLQRPFKTSFGVEHERECLILKLEGDGVAGWGECVAGEFPGYSYETAETAWHILQDFFLPALARYPLQAPEELRNALTAYRGHPLARAGLEMGLWDLLGKQNGQSLKTLLGGQRESVPVGVSIGVQKDVSAMLTKVETYLGQGYQRIKVKIMPGADLDIIAGIRQLYKGIRLQVDANSAYRIEDADHLKGLDRYDLELIEQPLAEDDILDHASLQKELETPICLDESILSVRHTRLALDAGACRVINIKPGRVGGLSEAKAIHDYCLARRIPVWCGGMLETNIGRAANLALASLPGFSLPGDISASERYYETDIATPGFVLNPDSTIDVPDQVGLGIEIDRDALERFSIKKKRIVFEEKR
jgi:O-succinylbenzoate synthase